MLAERVFFSLGAFAKFLDMQTAIVPLGAIGVAEASSLVLEERAKKLYGSDKLADLADATQTERERLGYSANEPLLRDGSLLRDTLERFADENTAAIGSNEPIHAYHEHGYINWRTGREVPPRPVFLYALQESEPEVQVLIENSVGVTLGFVGVVNVVAGAAIDQDVEPSLAQAFGYEE